MRLPHTTSVRQLLLQPSPFVVWPSSQVSPRPLCSLPPPQNSLRQTAEQLSPETLLPSSHCSVPSTRPLPHTVSERQVLEQPSPLRVLPSSQVSPRPACTTPSPQISGL